MGKTYRKFVIGSGNQANRGQIKYDHMSGGGVTPRHGWSFFLPAARGIEPVGNCAAGSYIAQRFWPISYFANGDQRWDIKSHEGEIS